MTVQGGCAGWLTLSDESKLPIVFVRWLRIRCAALRAGVER